MTTTIEKPPTQAKIGTRLHIAQVGRFGTITATAPAFGATRVIVTLDGGGFIDTTDRALGIRA